MAGHDDDDDDAYGTLVLIVCIANHIIKDLLTKGGGNKDWK